MRFVVAASVVALTCAAGVAFAGVEELSIGGRFMWDATAWSGIEEKVEGTWDDVDFLNGTETRRARVFLKGKVYENLKFKVVYDFAGGNEIALKDAYLDVVGVPGVGNVRVGQFFEPFCFNELTSSKYRSFLEAASPNAFAPGRNAGIMAHGDRAEGRLNYQAGLFLDTDGMAGKEGNEDVSVAARAAYLLTGEEKSDRVVHLGGAFTYLVPEDGVKFRQRPEVHLSDRLVDTGTLKNVDNVFRLGGEFAGVFGPFYFASEYVAATVARSDEDVPMEVRGDVWLADDASLSGYYVEVGYFLTGEHRIYDGGLWGRTKPDTNFLEDGGTGAWELVARYSSLDLNEETAGIHGGRMDNTTLGVNWHLHANARLMFNYVMSSLSDSDDEELGRANAFTMRTQFDF